MVAIINYGSGNLNVIQKVLNSSSSDARIVENPTELRNYDRIILPGVGDYDVTMKALNATGFREALERNVVEEGKPCMGICVGMQILGMSSDEGNEKGLGWIEGNVMKLPVKTDDNYVGPLLPHMGWNSINIKNEMGLFNNVSESQGFYFLHGYYFNCKNEKQIAAYTNYLGFSFPCVINKENIFGIQFHPEKSHKNGAILFENFLKYKN